MAKNTYGTGCFLLQNTGVEPIQSKFGLLTTVGYKLGKDAPAHFALEGSISVAGSLLRWLRDNLGELFFNRHLEKTVSDQITVIRFKTFFLQRIIFPYGYEDPAISFCVQQCVPIRSGFLGFWDPFQNFQVLSSQ